jgi:hypothetical protein
MNEDPGRQATIDDEHLKLLSIGYMIAAALTACFSLLGIFYAFMGWAIGYAVSHSAQAESAQPGPPPEFIGWIFGAIGIAIFIFMATMAVLKFMAGRYLRQHTSRTFIMVVAAISCLEVPYGTVLGAFTFIVLGRQSVMRLFR